MRRVAFYSAPGHFLILPEIEIWHRCKFILIGWLWWCIEIDYSHN